MNTTSTTPQTTQDANARTSVRNGWLATLAAGVAIGALALGATSLVSASPSTEPRQSATNEVAEPIPPTTTTPPTSDDGNDEYPRTVTVSGHGSVTVKPDTATLYVGVSVTGTTANEALRKAAEKADALIKALKATGVAEDDITTNDVSLYPEYNDEGDTVIRFSASHDIIATIRDIDTTGVVIDAAAGLVGDELTIGGISFSVADDSVALSEARREATADAQRRAADLTAGLDASVGQVLSINETSFGYEPYYADYSASAGTADVATPIASGTQDITVDVTVTFEIR